MAEGDGPGSGLFVGPLGPRLAVDLGPLLESLAHQLLVAARWPQRSGLEFLGIAGLCLGSSRQPGSPTL